jgi:hypothetical protein
MAPLKTANYGALFKKLRKELVESTLMPIDKKPKKDEQIYYLTNSQLWFLDVCDYKRYNVPPMFTFPMEVNQFMDNYAMKKTKFLEQHNEMSAPDIFLSYIYQFIFFNYVFI